MGTSVACNGLYVMSYMGLAKTFSTGAPTFDLGGGARFNQTGSCELCPILNCFCKFRLG